VQAQFFAVGPASIQTLDRTKLTLLSLMPSSETLESFVNLVEAGDTVEAMHRFYAEHASMQENAAPPRVGKVALIKHEEAALTSIASMKARCVRPIFVSGDFVVIRWVFEIQDKKGHTMRFDELAYQRWEGNLMAEEKFFYDPAQFK
jgi:SnoaL-like domain